MNSSGSRGSWRGAGLLFMAYFAAAKGGLYLDPVGGFATLVWPPAGIALAALLRWGPGLWPGVALGAFMANWSSGAPAAAAAGIAAGNTLEVVAAVFLLRKVFSFRDSLERVRDVAVLLLAAASTVIISASFGISSLWLAKVLPAGHLGGVWKAWIFGDLLGILTVAPAILTWGTPSSRRADWWPATEEGLFILCLVAANGLVFLPVIEDGPVRFMSAYLLIIPLFWAALRFKPSGTSLAVLATAAFAVWGTAEGSGPFGQGPLRERLYYLQSFMGAKTIACFLMSAAVAERGKAFRGLRSSEESLREANRGLESSLREKEILLREVHHRVKNNLQTVCSLLSLHAGRVRDAGASAALENCRERVMTMALVHEKLYRSTDLARVEFSAYLRDLARRLTWSLGGEDRKVEVDAEPVTLDVQEAVPCGLVVHELVSNALKHAFPGGRAGTVRVRLRNEEGGRVTLSVEDDGAGLPEGFSLKGTSSLGLSLVRSLAGQLGGELRREESDGTRFSVTFPRRGPARELTPAATAEA